MDDREPLFCWHGTWEEFDAEVRARWLDATARLGLGDEESEGGGTEADHG